MHPIVCRVGRYGGAFVGGAEGRRKVCCAAEASGRQRSGLLQRIDTSHPPVPTERTALEHGEVRAASSESSSMLHEFFDLTGCVVAHLFSKTFYTSSWTSIPVRWIG